MNPMTRKMVCNLSPLLMAIALMGVGCFGGSKIKPKAWNVRIVKTNTPASIEVDVIGIREEEKPEWEGYSIDKYWTPGDQKRADADKWTRSLEMGKYETLDSKDLRWKNWLGRGVNHLLIIARLPGSHPPGLADPRRKIISLDKRRWKGKTLEFQVRATEIRFLTLPKK
jgi:hypothetical protein